MINSENKDIPNDILIARNRSWLVRKDNELSFSILSLRYQWEAEMTYPKGNE